MGKECGNNHSCRLSAKVTEKLWNYHSCLSESLSAILVVSVTVAVTTGWRRTDSTCVSRCSRQRKGETQALQVRTVTLGVVVLGTTGTCTVGILLSSDLYSSLNLIEKCILADNCKILEWQGWCINWCDKLFHL